MAVLIRNRDVFGLCQGQHPYLDYYIYSSFTENPSNQCLIHSKQDCMNCLNSCVDAFAGGSCCDVWWCFWNPTWRIIPFSKWLITMISKSPNWGCSPSKWPKWLVNGGVTTYLPTGMILQVCESVLCYCCLLSCSRSGNNTTLLLYGARTMDTIFWALWWQGWQPCKIHDIPVIWRKEKDEVKWIEQHF